MGFYRVTLFITLPRGFAMTILKEPCYWKFFMSCSYLGQFAHSWTKTYSYATCSTVPMSLGGIYSPSSSADFSLHVLCFFVLSSSFFPFLLCQVVQYCNILVVSQISLIHWSKNYSKWTHAKLMGRLKNIQEWRRNYYIYLLCNWVFEYL